MASVNKVILVGNLGRDPETRYAPSGDAICNVTIATAEQWKDKGTGEKREATEWHRVVFFGKLAEIAGQYLKKGRQIYVEGSLRTRKWTDKDGQERYTTEIRADEMKMLGNREGGGDSSSSSSRDSGDYGNRGEDGGGYSSAPPSRASARSNAPSRPEPSPAAGGFGDFDDDIPF